MEIVTQWSFQMFEYAISAHTATLYWFAEPISEWGHLQKIVRFCAATKCRLEWNLISANVAFCLPSWCSFARSSFSTPGWHQLIVIVTHLHKYCFSNKLTFRFYHFHNSQKLSEIKLLQKSIWCFPAGILWTSFNIHKIDPLLHLVLLPSGRLGAVSILFGMEQLGFFMIECFLDALQICFWVPAWCTMNLLLSIKASCSPGIFNTWKPLISSSCGNLSFM